MTGTSARENLTDVRDYFETQVIPSTRNRLPIVVDVGAGQGTYADALAGLPLSLEAVESWAPSVERLKADKRYRIVYDKDIREAGGRGLYQGTSAVIFGDVLEHMTIHEAHVVFATAWRYTRHLIVSVPNSSYPQGAIDGNHLEEHIILDPAKELIPFLPPYSQRWEYPVTDTYVWRKY